MQKLKQLGIGTYLKSARRAGDDLGTEFSIIHDDLQNLYSYTYQYSDLLEKTRGIGNVQPFTNGLDGENLFIDSQILSGNFYNYSLDRPKTISEAFTEIYNSIDVSLGSSDVSTEFLTVKDKIGQNLFDNQLESSDTSLDKQVENVNLRLSQLAADCFNRGTKIGDPQNLSQYSLGTDAIQTQEFSLRDLVEKLLEKHGGIHHLGHSDLGQKMVWSSVFSNTEIVNGGDTKYAAPFADAYKDFEDSDKFYNPLPNPVKLTRLYVYIDDNTLVDNTTVTVLKNGVPTEMELHVAGGTTGSSFYQELDVTLEPNSYVQFRTEAGSVPVGSVHLANISITLQEII